MTAIVRDRLLLRDHLLIVLKNAINERNQRSEVVPDPNRLGFKELGWVLFERETMFTAVNKERSSRGLNAVDMKEFLRVEQLAVGHCDYSRKLALYCAELAVGETPFA